MKAFRLLDWGIVALDEVPTPSPGAGQVLVRVAGTGLCQSDLHFMDAGRDGLRYRPPFTLGHEIAGWVERFGPDVGGGADTLSVGAPVALYTIDFCGRCTYCLSGAQNYCTSAGSGRGFGKDGGLAEYVLARPEQVVALGNLEPRMAPPLTDAGMTSYHAVAKVLPKVQPGAVVAVVGVGGLGAFALQFLRELTPATVVALDIRPDRVPYALELGAAEVVTDSGELVSAVRERTRGRGADVVLDFVGASQTIQTALMCAAVRGSVIVIGVGAGVAEVRRGDLPFECELLFTRAGTPTDLTAVVALAEAGRISIDAEHYTLDNTAGAYADLRAGRLRGRAVVVPNVAS